MKYFSKIIDKPNAVIEEQRDGFRLVKQTKLCTFKNGVFETEDPDIISKLNKHPDKFSTTPWTTPYNWKTTEEGIKLLKEGEKLGIDCRHIRKEYLMKLIEESKPVVEKVKEEGVWSEPEKVEIKEIEEEKEIEVPKPTTKVVKVDYREIMRLAKANGIKSFGKKKKALEKALKEKGVDING